ncbi:probable E3 ubiquitin-protein ligase bre1 isoform X2 [Leptopilina boulardi]|uniref:probable E3 ubiquitin-protein ligase bre1 isoform X2 n=1 Tax=Leptopilina boulardi TaxID=63433 RepID=UPI0021F5E290|nr:probable E3 ubiquitin-protein ligase bre1 isoform X2 [Leptopilina boulardi]
MDDDGETTEEDSPSNKQEMKLEVKSDINSNIKSVIKLDINSDNNFEIIPQEQQVKLTSSNSSVKTNENFIESHEMGDNLIVEKNIDSLIKKDVSKIEKHETTMRHDVGKMNFPPRSSCKPYSRDPRRCQKHFREMIDLHEMKNEELEKREGNLRQRLEMLECSMPAVVACNIWRMAQGTSAQNMRQVVEKQFENFASDTPCPSTPSQHYDCRVRQVEAERKQARRRADEARALWSEKEFALGEQKRKLEEAKKTQTQHKERIEKLKAEVQELRKLKEEEKEANGDSCEMGECGEIKCKQWLGDVASTTMVKSTDLKCLARLQDLAEAELCMKRNIFELERREETYMRTLQQADELWSKMETDGASTTSALQEQLELKALANQQLADKVCSLEDTIESLNKKLANCKNELKLHQVDRIDKIVGDDTNAKVSDKDSMAKTTTMEKCTSFKKMELATKDQNTLKTCMSSKISGISCRDEMLHKCLSTKNINSKDQMTMEKCVSAKKVNKDQMTIEKCTSSKRIGTPSKDKMDRCLSAKKIPVASKDQMTIEKCTASKEITCKGETLDRSVSAKQVNIASKHQMTDGENDDYLSCDGSENDSDSDGETCAANFACNDIEDDEIQSTYEEIIEDDNLGKNSPLDAKESHLQLSKSVHKNAKLQEDTEFKESEPVEVNQKKEEPNKKYQTNIESIDQKIPNIENLQESEPTKTDETDDIAVPKTELKSWLESTTNLEKTIAMPLEEITEYEKIITPEILSETVIKQSELTEELEMFKSSKEFGQYHEVLESKEKIYEPDEKKQSSEEIKEPDEKVKETIENTEPDEKVTETIENTEPSVKLDESLENTPDEDINQPLAKIKSDESLEYLEEKIESHTEKEDENDKQLVADVEKEEKINESFSKEAKVIDEKIEDKEEINDQKEEINNISEDKQVLSESIENEDKLSNAGDNDEFAEKPIISKEEKEEEDDEVEKDSEIAIFREKSQIMTESSPSIPEEAKVVIVQVTVTPPPDEVIKNPENSDLNEEIPQLSQKIESKESLEKLAKSDSDCICKPEKNLKQTKSESIEQKISLSEKADDSQESICTFRNEISKKKSKFRPKRIYYIIRGTFCKRFEQVSLTSQEESSEEIERRRKLSHIKVKDESIGTVVSVGQQTEKKIRKQPTPMRKMKKIQAEGSDYISVSSVNLNNESNDSKDETKRNLKSTESEFTCDICKKFVSPNAVDNGSHVQATLTQKLIGFQSEINTCCSCKRQQNSNLKFQTEETIETHEVGKQFSRGKASAKPISRETVEDVTINSHVGVNKKFYTPQKNSEASYLAKLIKNKNDCRDKKHKIEVKSRAKNTESSLEPQVEFNNNNNNNSSFSNIDSDCICEKNSSLSGKKLTEREKQFKMEKNHSCHCDDSD